MPSSFWKRKVVEAGSVILLCLFFLWWNPEKVLTPVRNFLWIIVEPIALFSQYSQILISDTIQSVVHISTLRQKNAELSSEIITLKSRLAELKDIEKENEQFRSEIQVASRRPEKIAVAIVVGYDSRGLGDWLLINKGSRDGLVSGMTVISGENVLVGKIEEVLTSTARVSIITHPKSVFNAHTVETQAKGIVRGKFGIGILLDSVLQTENIREGDTVVTSEWGEHYPPGLYVGTISQVGVSTDGLFQQATLSSPIDFFKLKTVTVIR